MKDPCLIPTNFRVPKDCWHEWVLFYEREVIGVIWGVPGRKQIHQSFRAPAAGYVKPGSKLQNQSLDWITESVMHLRHLCGADK